MDSAPLSGREEPMMNRSIALAFLVPFVMSARIVIESPIPDLFEKSDLVCRGAVLTETQLAADSLDARGKLRPVDYTTLVEARSCYKGTISGSTLALLFRSVDRTRGMPLSFGPLLLFLKRETEGTYVLTDDSASLPFWDVPLKTRDGEGGIAELEGDLVEIATALDLPSSRGAMQMLLRFPRLSEASLLKLKSVQSATEPNLAILRLVLLVKSDATANLAELTRVVIKRDPSAQLPAIEEIGQIFAYQSSSSDLESLKEMSHSGFSYLRQSAMRGIRRIKDPSTVPFLIEQLDSDDLDVQYLAVITLAEMTGRSGDFGPSLPLFEQNPGKHKQLWREWWAVEGFQMVVR